MSTSTVAIFPKLRLVEPIEAGTVNEKDRAKIRLMWLESVRESLEEELAEIKTWAEEGAWVVEIEGRKPQKRWPDPIRKNKKGEPMTRSTVKFSLKDWPQMQFNRRRRNELLARIREVSELIQRMN